MTKSQDLWNSWVVYARMLRELANEVRSIYGDNCNNGPVVISVSNERTVQVEYVHESLKHLIPKVGEIARDWGFSYVEFLFSDHEEKELSLITGMITKTYDPSHPSTK